MSISTKNVINPRDLKRRSSAVQKEITKQLQTELTELTITNKSKNQHITISKTLSKSLQGRIYLGNISSNNKKVIIKSTNKILTSKNYGIHNEKYVKLSENIIKEASILQYIKTSTKHPKLGIIKLIDFCNDKYNYYLIENFGGKNGLTYILNEHKSIHLNKLTLNDHKINIKKYFGQIINTFNWLHNYFNVVHMDVSLENMLYDKNNDYFILCDFGLSEMIKSQNNSNGNQLSKKYVGKPNYMSPEITKHTPFNPKSNDVWGLGVCLFMMWFGLAAYSKANEDDDSFYNIFNGFLVTMIKSYDMHNYIDHEICGLLNKIFVDEKDRYTIEDIMNHNFLKSYKFDQF